MTGIERLQSGFTEMGIIMEVLAKQGDSLLRI